MIIKLVKNLFLYSRKYRDSQGNRQPTIHIIDCYRDFVHRKNKCLLELIQSYLTCADIQRFCAYARNVHKYFY